MYECIDQMREEASESTLADFFNTFLDKLEAIEKSHVRYDEIAYQLYKTEEPGDTEKIKEIEQRLTDEHKNQRVLAECKKVTIALLMLEHAPSEEARQKAAVMIKDSFSTLMRSMDKAMLNMDAQSDLGTMMLTASGAEVDTEPEHVYDAKKRMRGDDTGGLDYGVN